MGYKDRWAHWLKKAGVKAVPANPGLQCDTSLMAFELAEEGVGIALGRTSMTAKDLANGHLIAPFALAVPVEEGFHLISRDNAQHAPQAVAFRAWILEMARK
jgi:LysR family glycine cleavage system transcriptional activator